MTSPAGMRPAREVAHELVNNEHRQYCSLSLKYGHGELCDALTAMVEREREAVREACAKAIEPGEEWLGTDHGYAIRVGATRVIRALDLTGGMK